MAFTQGNVAVSIDVTLGARRLRVLTLDDLDSAGMRVLVRVDYNVPLADGLVADDSRIRASLPTVNHLLETGAAVVLMSHLGRPKGPDPDLSMAPVAETLADLLGRPVRLAAGVVGEEVARAAASLSPGQVLLLENLRFDAREKANDPDLARQLAALADAYVDDAFGTAHRAEASTVGVPALLPAYAGRLMARELEMLGAAVHEPQRPFAVIVGGAKISDKMGVLEHLLPLTDAFLVGGGIANTFLAAAGVPMGDSLMQPDRISDAQRIRDAAGRRLHLPVDLVVGDAFSADAASRITSADQAGGVADGWRALDIGPATVAAFATVLATCRTVIWNGPMGAFELEPFAAGTMGVADVVAGLRGALTIVGGGDSIAALAAAGLTGSVDWVSTGGGAMLALLAGEPLPAVEALAVTQE